MLMPEHFLEVSQVVRLIKSDLEADPKLGRVWVKGEVSNFKKAFSGHLYFTIKDEKASLRCVMFANAARGLTFDLDDGMDILVQGRVSVFEAAGSVQLYVNTILPVGQGALYLAFTQLKERLEKEGFFDQKKVIPMLPSRIGIVTSATGSVLHDIHQVALRRNPTVQLILVKASVQGKNSSPEIVGGIEMLNRYNQVDVIIVGRGGGSLEDLWSFNTEEVGRAIKASKIPVVSAVGHETDFTIADFVSDLRAPTPSAAAEMIVPDAYQRLEQQAQRLSMVMDHMILYLERSWQQLRRIGDKELLEMLLRSIERFREKIDYMHERSKAASRQSVFEHKETLAHLEGRLSGLNPLSTLNRGYAIAYQGDQYIQSVGQIDKDQEMLVRFVDGQVRVEVKEVEKYE